MNCSLTLEREEIKSQHSNLKKEGKVEKLTFRERNGIDKKLFKVEEQRKVQWQQHGMETVDTVLKNASVQCTIQETYEEREGLRSAATQWSDQEAHRKNKFTAATQWSPADFSPLKTIPGYTGHLPGRHYVNPGKTFCQEMDALLKNSAAVVPLSRHTFTSALQQMTNNKPEGKDDPYFDNRPPSTYLNNYPIPGYQGFVPRVRTSTSSLGIRYIKAVEKSLHALHEQKQHKKENDDETANSPNKLLERRPLHTPRHRPHPKPQPPPNEDDWRVIYKRPPSTYLDSSKTFIPGYKGFIPHLRGSPNAVGIRYSKAALRCVEKTQIKQEKSEKSQEGSENQENIVEVNQQQSEMCENQQNDRLPEQEDNTKKEDDADIEDQIQDYGDAGSDSDNGIEEENKSYATENNRFHSDYLRDRKPSTYKSDERHPIPGYQGFIPRLRDSPTTLGLRYTKAALKTLQDIHKNQQRTRER